MSIYNTFSQFVNRLANNKLAAKAYYNSNINKYYWAYRNKYSFENFYLLLQNINKISINKHVLNKFKHTLNRKKANRIMKNIKYSSLPLTSNKTTYKFTSVIKHQSNYQELNNFHNVWNIQLIKLLPKNFNNLINRLKLDKETSLANISTVVKDLRHSLIQKSYKSKVQKRQIWQLSQEEIILSYLEDILPNNRTTTAWKKNFKLSLKQFKNKSSSSGNYVYQDTALIATLLDKKNNLFRVLRSIDSSQNCLSSGNKKFTWGDNDHYSGFKFPNSIWPKVKLVSKRCNLTPIKCLADIIKDPLTFVIDIKEINSNRLIGFTFGRYAINSLTGFPIVMINDIYVSQDKTELTFDYPKIVESILNIIEKSIAHTIGADSILFPNNGNKGLDKIPDLKIKTIKVERLIAINNIIGQPKQIIFDDYGDEANCESTLTVYVKTLNKSPINKEFNQNISDILSAKLSLVFELTPVLPFSLKILFLSISYFFKKPLPNAFLSFGIKISQIYSLTMAYIIQHVIDLFI